MWSAQVPEKFKYMEMKCKALKWEQYDISSTTDFVWLSYLHIIINEYALIVFLYNGEATEYDDRLMSIITATVVDDTWNPRSVIGALLTLSCER